MDNKPIYNEDQTVVTINGIEYEARKAGSWGCEGCDLYSVFKKTKNCPRCVPGERKDKRSVIWKKKNKK